jgi:hypothetical protein
LYLNRPLTDILPVLIGFDISASKERNFLKFSAAEIINYFSPRGFVGTVFQAVGCPRVGILATYLPPRLPATFEELNRGAFHNTCDNSGFTCLHRKLSLGL